MSVPVSGLQEAVENVRKELLGGPNPPLMEKLIYPSGKSIATEILSRFYVQAQLSALEIVAKEMCPHCKSGVPLVLEGGVMWAHAWEDGDFDGCDSAPIWARLRSEAGSGSEPGKETAR